MSFKNEVLSLRVIKLVFGGLSIHLFYTRNLLKRTLNMNQKETKKICCAHARLSSFF